MDSNALARRKRSAVQTLVLSIVAAGLAVPALTGSAAGHAHPALPTPPGEPVDLARVTEQPDAPGAARVARATGRPIEIAAERTAFGQTFALPTGGFRRDQDLTAQRARRADGSWGPIDTSLVRGPDGTVRPANIPIQLAFSGGGTSPLLTMDDNDGHRISLSWPHPLPRPAVDGDVATYADVLPGVDLQLRADADGPRKTLVVKDRAAAANPALAEIALGLRTQGVRLSVGASNNLIATDLSGRMVFVTPPMLMWEADDGPPRFGNEPGAAWAPPAGARSAPVRVSLSGTQLRLTPDRSLLTDPTARYPLRIDPAFRAVGQNFWLLIISSDPNVPYWNGGTRNGDPSGDVAVGRTLWNGSQFSIRDFLTFDASFFANKRIISGRLQLTMLHSWSFSCTEPSFPFHVRAVSGLNGNTTWNNQNVWGATLAATDWTRGNNGGQCPNDTDVSFDVTGRVSEMAAAGASTIDFGLISPNESCVPRSGSTHCPGWRRFSDTGNAVDGGLPIRLSVNYNDLPSVPGDLRIDGQVCNNTTVGLGAAATYTVQATLSDPNGETVNGQLQVRQGTTVVHSQSTGHVGSGTRATWQLNAAVLQSGQSYSLRASAIDNEPAQGPWTPGCTLTVDRTVPAAPTVSSTDYPAGDTQHGSVGRTGQFTISTGAADVVRYRYGFTDPPTSEVTPATPGAAVVLPVTPPRDGPVTFYAQALDGVGNTSTVTRYVFGVRPGTGPVGHWKLDETTGATAADTPSPDNPNDVARPVTFTGTTQWTANPIDARLNHERYLRANGTALGSTAQPVIDTTRGYTVAAWVRVSALPTGNRTFLSVDGSRVAGFFLQYNQTDNRWRFSLTRTDTDTPAMVGVSSASPPRLNAWTHVAGTYDPMTARASFYVDGVLAGSVAVPGTWAAGNVAVGWARWNGIPGLGWPGDLDDVRVYDRVVQPVEFIGFVKRVDAWYSFHDGQTGTVTDRSGFGRNGTFRNGAGVSVGFDGLGGTFYGHLGAATVDVPDVRTDESFTVSAWVRLLRDDAGQTAVAMDGTQLSAFALRFDATLNRWTFALPDTDVQTATVIRAVSFGPPKPGEWTHLSGVYDAQNGRIQLWVNGQLEGTAPRTASWRATGPLTIGRGLEASVTNGWWYGDIDEVMLHSGALGSPEIQVLADATRRVPAAQHLAGDFTGDGKADTVVIHGYPNKVMKLWGLTNSGGGTLDPPVELWNSEFAPWEMPTGWQHDGAKWVAADFNGDGKCDIGVLLRREEFDGTAQRWRRNSEAWIFHANGAGFNEPIRAWDSGTGGAWPLDLLKVDAGDTTGDGKADLVLLREDSTSEYRVFVLAGTATGLVAPVQWHHNPAGAADPRRAVVHRIADMDNDGKADLVQAYHLEPNQTRMFVNRSDGTRFLGWTIAWDSNTTLYPMPRVKMVLSDATGDGRTDAVHYFDAGANRQFRLFRSNGIAPFAAPATWLDTATCTSCVSATGDWAALSLATGDLDGDGRDDLIGLQTTVDSRVIRIYTIRSTGTAYEQPVLRYTSGPDGM